MKDLTKAVLAALTVKVSEGYDFNEDVYHEGNFEGDIIGCDYGLGMYVVWEGIVYYEQFLTEEENTGHIGDAEFWVKAKDIIGY